MSDEKKRILEMIEQGKISSKEGLELLNALDENDDHKNVPVKNISDRFLRVRVRGDGVKVNKVDVNVPLSLVKVATVFMNMIPKEARTQMEEKGIDISQINFEEIIDLIDKGLSDGRLVDVDVDDPKEGKIKVEVYVD